MPNMTLDVPEAITAALKSAGDDPSREIKLAAAFHLCRQGIISTGLAAELAGLTYADLLEEAARRKVELFHYDAGEVDAELDRPTHEGANIEAIKQDLARAQSRRS